MQFTIEYDVEEKPVEEEYFFEAKADSLDDLISFCKTIDISNPGEASIRVYKDEHSGSYVVPFVANGPVSPLNYGEYLDVTRVEEKYWGIDERRTYITNLGMLAMMSVIA